MTALKEAVAKLEQNDRQWEAFNEDGHCAVLAPPGSGKTSLLTTKVAAAFAFDAIERPRGAACITMTNEAALQLRYRTRALGLGRQPNLFIGTVHAFAFSRIVLPLAAAAGEHALAASRWATEAEFDDAFETAFESMEFRPQERGEVHATAQKARQRLDLSGNPLLGGESIARFARRLQDELVGRGIFDAQDLVRHAVELVEQHDGIAKVLAATYPRVYVDEYQDLAPGLDRIVRSFTLRDDLDSTLFAVGDPDQSIYAFTGAHPELLQTLARESSVREVWLERSYRCGQALIELSLRALDQERTIVCERDGGSISVHKAPGGVVAQAAMAMELAVEASEAGVPVDEIAVIAPWARDRDACVGAMRAEGLPVYARSDDGWRTTPLTLSVEAMAAWAAGQDGGPELGEVLETFGSVVRDAGTHAVMKSVVAVLLQASANELACDFVEAIAGCAFQSYEDDKSSEDARELARMRAVLAEGGRLGEMTLGELGTRARTPGHVMASTIHGAKGLEFEVVIMVGADEVCLPGFSPSPAELAEARRKFYVTLTRARDRVHLVHTDQRISKKGNPYSVGPSPFIQPLLG